MIATNSGVLDEEYRLARLCAGLTSARVLVRKADCFTIIAVDQKREGSLAAIRPPWHGRDGLTERRTNTAQLAAHERADQAGALH